MRRELFQRTLLIGLFLLASAGIAVGPQLRAQTAVNPVNQTQWVTCPGVPRREFGVCFFRRTFDLASVPMHFALHASGDNRYELFVNGARVLEGPARGDLNHWRYETTDIAPQLRPGSNVIAAIVWNFAGQAPMAQMTHTTGLMVAAEGGQGALINTGADWKSIPDAAETMILIGSQLHYAYSVVGPGERVDASRYPWGWQQAGFDDSVWKPAVSQGRAGLRGIQDTHSRWMMVARSIPLMDEKPERLERLVRASGPAGFEAAADFLQGAKPLTIPARSHVILLLDQGYETTAYPELKTSGGKGSSITLTYAEALLDSHMQKGNRNETEGKHIVGFSDQFLPDGGSQRLFRPLWWRAYRYVQLDIHTSGQPLALDDFHGAFTAYPFAEKATFRSSDPQLEKIIATGWRTARLCAHETYMDCPYYEQLQYVGDTRIQALVSLYMSGDDRLVKNAIELINESRFPEGLTQSRYPSHLPQMIPTFSLYWIGMLHDLWWYRGDNDFIRTFLPGERGVLGWYEDHLTASGLLGKLPWWNFVDWNKDFKSGVPPQEADGQSAILTLEFANALKEAADLETALGNSGRARHYTQLASHLVQNVMKSCWDANRQLLADTPARKNFSQHANILGVLTGAIAPAEQRAVLEKVLSDTSLTQCSYYYRYYLFQAMQKAGLAGQYLDQLGPWRNMLALGLSTWAETPEPTRSDCHAWSAHPNIGLLAIVAGIEPGAAGFSKVRIAPHLGSLHQLDASVPHPDGTISVSYVVTGDRLKARVTLPPGLTGDFVWKGKQTPLHAGEQQLNL